MEVQNQSGIVEAPENPKLKKKKPWAFCRTLCFPQGTPWVPLGTIEPEHEPAELMMSHKQESKRIRYLTLLASFGFLSSASDEPDPRIDSVQKAGASSHLLCYR
jgi:hypothetical protein